MTLTDLNAVADTMRILNAAARAGRVSPLEAVRACDVLAKVMGIGVPAGPPEPSHDELCEQSEYVTVRIAE